MITALRLRISEDIVKSMLSDTVIMSFAGTAAVYALSFIGALFHYRHATIEQGTTISLRGLLVHLFPAQLVKGLWTRADILFYLSNKALFALVMPSAAAMTILAATGVSAGLAASSITGIAVPQNGVSIFIFLLGSLVLRDFAAFYIHLLQHRIPLLWSFHKVHHAPESLVPLTRHRLHPVELFANIATDSLLLGALSGAAAWLMNQDETELIASAISVLSISNMITLAPLRHSHIDLRLGRFERFVLSPAHHRVHHSVERQHWDKNFGALFPVWDRLWGTLVEPPKSNTYRLGLPEGKSNDYVKLWHAYSTPFREICQSWLKDGATASWRIGPLVQYTAPAPALRNNTQANLDGHSPTEHSA